MPHVNLQLVVISASQNDQGDLVRFFEKADYLLQDMAFIVVSPHEEEQEQLVNWVNHCCNSLQTKQVEGYTALSAGMIYFVPYGKHIVLNEGAFVHNNAMNSSSSSLINSFWQSIATYHSEAVCVSMQAEQAYMEGMLMVRDAGGMIILQEGGLGSLSGRRQAFLTEFDYILRAEYIPPAIRHHRSEQADWLTEEETSFSLDIPSPSSPPSPLTEDVPAPVQFNEWAARQFSPAVLFICPKTNKIVHVTDSVKRLLSLPNNSQGKVYTHLLEDTIVQAIQAIGEAIFMGRESSCVREVLVDDVSTAMQKHPIRLVGKNMIVHGSSLLVLKLENDYWMQEMDVVKSDSLEIDADYRKKINDLGELNDDLNNILQSTDIGTLFLDNELQVRKFTNSILQHIYLKQCKLGTSIKDLSWLIKYENLEEDALEVLKTKRFIEREVEHQNGDWFQVRIHPYSTADYTINGLVITFLKVSNIKKLKVRLNQLSEELEQQGLELVRTMMELREEVSRKKENATVLARQNALLASVLNSMTDGIIAVDDLGRIFMLNEMAQNLSGIQVGDDLGMWIDQRELLHLGTRRVVKKNANPFVHILQGEAVHNVEICIRQKGDLGVRYWKLNALPLRLEQEEGQGTVIAISDITRQKLYEISLYESEQTKKAILEAIPDVLFRLNNEGICLDYIPNVNQSIIPVAAFIDNHICDVLPNYVGEGIMETVKVVLKDKTVETYHFEVLEDDLFHFYETRISLVDKEEVLCMIRDITQQVIAEEAMLKSLAYFREMIKMNPAPVVLHDRNGKIIETNPALLKMLRIDSVEEIEECNVFSFINNTIERNNAKTVIKRGYTDELPKSTACYSITCLDGTCIKVEANASIITYKNQLVVHVVLKEV